MSGAIRLVHRPGYSAVDHTGAELLAMAEAEFLGRPQTMRSAEAAIRRAGRRALALARSHPETYGAFRWGLPLIVAVRP